MQDAYALIMSPQRKATSCGNILYLPGSQHKGRENRYQFSQAIPESKMELSNVEDARLNLDVLHRSFCCQMSSQWVDLSVSP